MRLFDNENDNRDYLLNKLKDNLLINEQNCFVDKATRNSCGERSKICQVFQNL
jgi:hypothetical protein